jgi:hypothetical protein
LAIYSKPLGAAVAVIVAVIGVLPVLIAINDAILPVPMPTNPIAGLSFTQL